MADERQPNLGLWAEPPQSEDALENFLRPMVWKLPWKIPSENYCWGFSWPAMCVIAKSGPDVATVD